MLFDACKFGCCNRNGDGAGEEAFTSAGGLGFLEGRADGCPNMVVRIARTEAAGASVDWSAGFHRVGAVEERMEADTWQTGRYTRIG